MHIFTNLVSIQKLSFFGFKRSAISIQLSAKDFQIKELADS
jgi:hypothetical protein